MEKKYYTPDLEDLHLGYYCEWNSPNEDDLWRPTNLDRTDIYSYIEDVQNNLNYTKLRTPCLSKEDIESLEWEFVWKVDYSTSMSKNDIRQFFRKNLKDDILLNFYYELVLLSDYRIAIYLCSPENKNGVRSFFGECKSINELKKILKWLKIK